MPSTLIITSRRSPANHVVSRVSRFARSALVARWLYVPSSRASRSASADFGPSASKVPAPRPWAPRARAEQTPAHTRLYLRASSIGREPPPPLPGPRLPPLLEGEGQSLPRTRSGGDSLPVVVSTPASTFEPKQLVAAPFFTLSKGRGRFGRLRPKSVRGLPGNHLRVTQMPPRADGWGEGLPRIQPLRATNLPHTEHPSA